MYATAIELAKSMQINYAPYSDLENQIKAADIILVSTNAETPVILKKDVAAIKQKVLIDLSIPNNIDVSVRDLSHITLINVDELSKQNDETLQKREAEIPQVKTIIADHISDFVEWHAMRSNVPVLKAVKQKLMEIHKDDLFNYEYTLPLVPSADDTETIQKVINTMAVKLRSNNTKGCQYIEAINDYITSGINS